MKSVTPFEPDENVTIWKTAVGGPVAAKAVAIRTVLSNESGIVTLDDGSEWYSNGFPTEPRWARARIAHTLDSDFGFIEKAKKIGRILELSSFLFGLRRLYRVTPDRLDALERSIYLTVADAVRHSIHVEEQTGQNREDAINDVLTDLKHRIERAELVAVRGASDADDP